MAAGRTRVRGREYFNKVEVRGAMGRTEEKGRERNGIGWIELPSSKKRTRAIYPHNPLDLCPLNYVIFSRGGEYGVKGDKEKGREGGRNWKHG